jgi:hypothetical protein
MKNDTQRREQALKEIQSNIAELGRHVYVVSASPTPRFAYTIGCSEVLGAEIIFAGASFYSLDEVVKIINYIAVNLQSQDAAEATSFEVSSCGSFSLRSVDISWVKMLMLGALDYYQKSSIPAIQIVPDEAHWTVDVPDLTEPWSSITAPAWQWLREPWMFPVPSKSTAITNLDALRGERITEAMRWEEGEWELFAGAGPEVPKDSIRVVPLGTLVAADASLEPVVNLRIGDGLWRDVDSMWHPWVTRGQA